MGFNCLASEFGYSIIFSLQKVKVNAGRSILARLHPPPSLISLYHMRKLAPAVCLDSRGELRGE